MAGLRGRGCWRRAPAPRVRWSPSPSPSPSPSLSRSPSPSPSLSLWFPRVRRSRSMCGGAADRRLKRRCAGEREIWRRRLPNARGDGRRATAEREGRWRGARRPRGREPWWRRRIRGASGRPGRPPWRRWTRERRSRRMGRTAAPRPEIQDAHVSAGARLRAGGHAVKPEGRRGGARLTGSKARG